MLQDVTARAPRSYDDCSLRLKKIRRCRFPMRTSCSICLERGRERDTYEQSSCSYVERRQRLQAWTSTPIRFARSTRPARVQIPPPPLQLCAVGKMRRMSETEQEGPDERETDWPSIKPDLTGGDETPRDPDPDDPTEPPRTD